MEPGLLSELTGTLGGRQRVVERVLFTELEGAVGQAWARGWQPAELVRDARRRLGRVSGSLVVDLVIAEHQRYAAARVAGEWAAQVRELGEPWWGNDAVRPGELAERHGSSWGDYVGNALCTLAWLGALAPLQVLLPPPGQARATEENTGNAGEGADLAKLARVRALLAKAEATEFSEEAEALSARAQEMIARYRIDHAALTAETGVNAEVKGRRLPVDAPYEQHKALLLEVVARANACRSVWHHRLGLCTVLGLARDVNAVELLFTSLLTQATRAMRQAGTSRDSYGRSRTRAFRSSFLAAFAARIGERLAEAASSGEHRAVREYARTGTDLLPVLAVRDRKVTEAVEEAFGGLETKRFRHAGDARGWWAGRTAADSAALRTGESIER
ncbi:DUF2786 domain-containing protein [Nocardiopsis alba]|uniref:DUF2786 domain-containing protein n=1 Tax=Nocardiopsis alba TaxID=53437 RepID=UPI00366FF490